MSGIFGIFNRNGKPVEEKIVNTMLNAMSYWKPDNMGVWIDGPIALGHTMLWNTPESKYEHFPLHKDAYILTMDARIDNRDELIKELELPDRPLAEIGDSEFILASYKKWGEECPKHLLGDFAFAIWDEKKEQLFCARDHVGIKPFYYHLTDDVLVFSNDIRGLIVHGEISKIINDEAVAIYLTKGELWHPEMTFFETIQKLPPATSLIVSSKKMSKKIYWKAEDSPKIKFNSLEEYSVKLRELLEDSVKKRLRSEKPIASHLSGGLDSSTISVIAARDLHLQNKILQVYNWVQAPKEEDDSEYYEWANSRKISEIENIEHHYIDFSEVELSDILKNNDIAVNDPVGIWYEFLVRQEAQKGDVQTILSGWGGDELITYSGYAYCSDMLRQGKIISSMKGLYNESKKEKNILKKFILNFYYKLVVPFFPIWLYCYLPKIKCESVNYLQCANLTFREKISDILISTTHYDEKSIHTDQLDLYNNGHIIHRIEAWASAGLKERIEYAYPLLDKRIVEFSLGVPSQLYKQKGIGRFLFRHAISNLLPENIRWGDFKLETNRVDLLIKIEKDALRNWLKTFKKTNSPQYTNIYIDYILLKSKIQSLDNSRLTLLDINTIDAILKSILILSLNKYNKKM